MIIHNSDNSFNKKQKNQIVSDQFGTFPFLVFLRTCWRLWFIFIVTMFRKDVQYIHFCLSKKQLNKKLWVFTSQLTVCCVDWREESLNLWTDGNTGGREADSKYCTLARSSSWKSPLHPSNVTSGMKPSDAHVRWKTSCFLLQVQSEGHKRYKTPARTKWKCFSLTFLSSAAFGLFQLTILTSRRRFPVLVLTAAGLRLHASQRQTERRHEATRGPPTTKLKFSLTEVAWMPLCKTPRTAAWLMTPLRRR